TNDTIGFANDSLSLLTDSAWILTIPSLMDANCSFTFSNDADTLDIFTLQNAFFNLDTVACITDTLTINGTDFFAGNDSYQDTIPGSRCDSIISIMVNFQDADTVYFNLTICAGDSTMIGSIFYGENNPTDEVIVSNPNGCDSITIINISFYPQVGSLLTVPLCAGESTTINGTIYDDTNMSNQDTLFNQSANGCDSIVMVQIIPTTGVTIDRNDTLCIGDFIVVGGQTFDFNNQTDQVILNGSGCDTTVNVALNFHVVQDGSVSGIFCPDYEIEINGTTYDFNNRTGTEPFPNGSQVGCDSIVTINLDFETPIITPYNDDICGDEFIEVNGTIYNQNNLSDTEVFVGGSISGCDSTVIVTLNWSPAYNESNAAVRCEGDSIFLAGAFQFVSGTYIDTFQSIGLCDSIISTGVTFMSCLVDVAISTTNNICAGESAGGFSIDIISSIEIPYTITWVGQDNGTTDQITIDSPQNMVNVTNLSSDIYTISIIDTDGITIYQETIEVMDMNPPLSGTWTEVEAILCFDSLGSIEFIVSGGMPTYSYNWSESNIGNTSVAENVIAGDYSLTITDQNGCTTDTTYTLINPDEISFTVTSTDLSCEGISNGQIAISNITGGQAPYSILIDNSLVVGSVIDSLQEDMYEIIVEDINGCRQIMNEEILSGANIELAMYQMEYTITVGDSVNIIATVTEDSLTCAWTNDSTLSCNNCQTPVATPSSTTTYELTVTSQQGCSQLVTILVIVEEVELKFEVANIFSPNDDTVNDKLIFDYGSDKTVSVEIFDRWGNRVFQETLSNGVISWDGIYDGSILKPGVFVYHVQITDSEGNMESKFGDVMLLR
ncbi:MAG: gliding motility-associated-like protein, partial [Saprospiraceae bacterium]